LDDVISIESPNRIDLIKIDVEGWEHDVLKGSKRIVEKFRPLIFFESWKSFKKPFSAGISEEIDFLMSMNYCVTSYHNNRVHLLKQNEEILTKDLLAVPVENKSLF
jgi:hypothetical protein